MVDSEHIVQHVCVFLVGFGVEDYIEVLLVDFAVE